MAAKGKSKPVGFGAKISSATKGKPKEWMKGEKNHNYGGKTINRPDVREKFLAASKKRGQVWSQEEKDRHSKRMLGASNKMRGRHHTQETKDIIRDKKNELLRNGAIAFSWNKISKPEKEIGLILQKLNIPYKAQFHISGLPYNYDFFILNTNIIIEFNGDYWHCNPKKFKSGQLIRFNQIGEKSADEIWERDRIKIKSAEQAGYVVLVIWQDDYNKFGLPYVIEQLNKFGAIKNQDL